MTTAYNIRNALARSGSAKRQFIADPGAGGTVKVYPQDLNVLQIDSTGARTLQAAAQVPVGTQVLACATSSGVTVNGFAISDGGAVEFTVVLNASAANAWRVTFDSDVEAASRGAYVATVETTLDDTATMTAAMMLKKIINAVPTAAASFTLPNAGLLVAAIPGATVGDTLEFIITNNSAGANTITVLQSADATGTVDGTVTVAQNVVRKFVVNITNVTAASEAYVCYGIG